MRSRIDAARARIDAMAGNIAIYGACAYSQGLFGLYSDISPIAAFDDTAAYEGHEAFWQGGRLTVYRPTAERLADIDHVIVCAYLHDEPIAENLRRCGFAGKAYSLRTDDQSVSSKRLAWQCRAAMAASR